MADFNDAISRDPRSPCLYEKRGAFRVNRGDYQRGAADIAHALQLNPADRAATFEGWPKNAVAKEAAQHGERQLRQMLRDRPTMAKFGESGGAPLYEWVAQICRRGFRPEDLLGRRARSGIQHRRHLPIAGGGANVHPGEIAPAPAAKRRTKDRFGDRFAGHNTDLLTKTPYDGKRKGLGGLGRFPTRGSRGPEHARN